MEEEVGENEDVHKEDEEEDDHPAFGNVVDAAGSVLLGFEGTVEVLPSEVIQERHTGGVVLG